MTETWDAGTRSRTIDADESINDAGALLGELRESFGAFYQRELRAVTGLGFVLSGNRTVAEDIAQDAFVGAYRRWDRLSAYDDPGAWVRRVVANRAISGYRRRMTEMRGLLRLGRERPPDDVYANGAFDLDAATERLWVAVRELPARQAQAIVLKHLEGRTVAETAAILDCSENTVKTHLSRARQTLAQRLTASTSDEGDHR